MGSNLGAGVYVSKGVGGREVGRWGQDCFFGEKRNCPVGRLTGEAKSGRAFLHSDQFGYEECLCQCGFTPRVGSVLGDLADTRPLTDSWASGLMILYYMI